MTSRSSSMPTRRRKLLERRFAQWSAGALRASLLAAVLLGVMAAVQPANARIGGCGAAPGFTIVQLDKATGALVRTVTSCNFAPGGLSDDPTTFAPQFLELLWTKNASANQLEVVEIPGGTLGQRSGTPVLFPGVGDPAVATSCPRGPTGYTSTSGDALLDCWKNPPTAWSDGLPGISYQGIYDGNVAHRDTVLCAGPTDTQANIAANCATDITKKDAFVEIDYMPPHLPNATALNDVVQMFANAPTPPGPIRMHFQIDDQIPHNNTTALVPCTPAAASGNADFDLLKAQFFGTAAERSALANKPNTLNAKALAFRYGMFVH